MEFIVQKELRLQKNDLSRKGSIDEKIIELVEFINSLDCYVTTSSCSGRISVFTNSELKKKGCNWIYIAHDVTVPQLVIDALNSHTGSAILKFEPFIMHIQCNSLEDAQKLEINDLETEIDGRMKQMHVASIESGFRNSGLTVSKKGNIVVAIRSTLALEVPLSSDGVLLVSNEYISFVVNLCNEKLKENWQRIARLFVNLKNIVSQPKKITKEEHKKSFHNKDINLPCEKHDQEIDKRLSPDLFCDGLDNLLN